MDNDPFASRVILITWTENSDLLTNLKHKVAPNLHWTKPKSRGSSSGRSDLFRVSEACPCHFCYLHGFDVLLRLKYSVSLPSSFRVRSWQRFHLWKLMQVCPYLVHQDVNGAPNRCFFGISWVLWIRSWPRRDQTFFFLKEEIKLLIDFLPQADLVLSHSGRNRHRWCKSAENISWRWSIGNHYF